MGNLNGNALTRPSLEGRRRTPCPFRADSLRLFPTRADASSKKNSPRGLLSTARGKPFALGRPGQKTRPGPLRLSVVSREEEGEEEAEEERWRRRSEDCYVAVISLAILSCHLPLQLASIRISSPTSRYFAYLSL